MASLSNRKIEEHNAGTQSESSSERSNVESSDEFENYPGKSAISSSTSEPQGTSTSFDPFDQSVPGPSNLGQPTETEVLQSLPTYARRLPCNFCLFFRSPYGCLKGSECSFCHHSPNEQGGPQVARPRKLRRDRCKSKVQQLLETLTAEQGPDEVINAIQAEAQRNKYSRTLCQNLLDDWLSQNGEGHTRKSMELGLKSAWGQGGTSFLSTLVQLGASFVIVFYGGNLALHHEFDVGTIITFSYLWNRLSSAFTSLNENINQPVKAVSAGQRVFELLDLKPDIQEDFGEPFPEDSREVGIRFENVSFAYQSRQDKKVLSKITLDLRAGKTTAVVGKSGCGKSTLSKLLLRFYDPQSGAVFLNASELHRMHLQQYRSKVGVVSQDTQLFRLTVSQNITYGLRESECTHEEVENAAKLANAHEFIEGLPEGYNTMVGEGGHDLSGGQKQRLSIARALVRRPRILLLDEATSALDAENEAYVQAALDDLMKQMQGTCTIMIIAHRLSTIKDADWIIVLHEGQVAEEGSHEQLLQIKDGRYATLINRQLNGNDDGDGAGENGDGKKTVSQALKEMLQILAAVPKEKRMELFMGFAKEAKKQS